MNPPSTTPVRYPSLDFLRLVAIGMTVLVHSPSLVGRIPFLRPFGDGLWLGVDLFMLISGWLLGGQLLREAKLGRFRPGVFYLKRWLRTLPPYYAMLALLYFGRDPSLAPVQPTQLLTHLTFLQNYFGPNLYGVSWSLCVEEHFYLVLPLLIAALLRRPRLSTVVGLVVGMQALSVLLRWHIFTMNPVRDVPYASHLRCDGLFLGLLLAWMHLFSPDLWRRIGKFANAALPVGVLLTLVVMGSVKTSAGQWMFVGAATAGSWALVLVFISSVHEQSWASRISFPGLRYMGELTYAVYLVRSFIPHGWLGGREGLIGVAWRLVLVLGLSILLHHLVERPALRLRERILAVFAAEHIPAKTATENVL